MDPPNRLAWTYAGQLYRFELSAHADGCRLIFTHVIDEGMPAAQTATGWETYLLRLDVRLGGGRLRPAGP